MIDVLAVRSPGKWGSRFMCWGLGEAASHLAIRFPGERVAHSELKGVWFQDEREFLDGHVLVGSWSLEASKVQAEAVLIELGAAVGLPYDRSAFVYFAYRAALRRFLGIPLPDSNGGDVRDSLLCVELLYAFIDAYARLVGRVPSVDLPKALGIMTPLDALAYVKEAYPCATPSSPSP